MKKAGIGISMDTKYLIYLIPLALSILICAHVYLALLAAAKNSQLSRLNREWQAQEPQRKALEAFNKEYASVSEGARSMQQLTKQRINWAEKLNKLSLLLPSGVWFNEVSVSSSGFALDGSVVSLQKEEMNLIKGLIDNLKNDAGFFRDFNSLELNSVEKRALGGYEIADFAITGTLKPR